jgi:hypothetical protein
MNKRIKAPKYFLELRKEGDEYVKEFAEMLGVGFEWLRAKLESPKKQHLRDFLKEKTQYWSREKLNRLHLLSNISADYNNLAWDLLKYNNKAARECEMMEYDLKNETIILKSGFFKILKKFTDKLLETLPFSIQNKKL